MSANWSYMVDYLAGNTVSLTDTSDPTDLHCLYVEAMLLPHDAIITRQPPHAAKPPVDLSA